MLVNLEFFLSKWLNFSYFYLGYQIIYCYLPLFLLVIINLFIIYTIYQLMFMPLIESSSQRDLKIKQVKRNESVIMFLTINFGLTTLPNEVFKTILFFNYETINSNGIYILLNFFELFLILFNFISFLVNFKNLRQLFMINFVKITYFVNTSCQENK